MRKKIIALVMRGSFDALQWHFERAASSFADKVHTTCVSLWIAYNLILIVFVGRLLAYSICKEITSELILYRGHLREAEKVDRANVHETVVLRDFKWGAWRMCRTGSGFCSNVRKTKSERKWERGQEGKIRRKGGKRGKRRCVRCYILAWRNLMDRG